jgi:hypothetical protein
VLGFRLFSAWRGDGHRHGRRSDWTFLTNHARVLLSIAADPQVRVRDIAAHLGITERAAHSIVADLLAAGHVERERKGRRNRNAIGPALASRQPARHSGAGAHRPVHPRRRLASSADASTWNSVPRPVMAKTRFRWRGMPDNTTVLCC